MLACSNVHVSGETSIFGNAFSKDFFSFPRVCNPYKRLQGDGFLCHWLVLCFLWMCMARHWRMFPVLGFSDCS